MDKKKTNRNIKGIEEILYVMSEERMEMENITFLCLIR